MSDATLRGPEHRPVLLEKVLECLAPGPGMVVVDGTVGSGGHAAAILPRILPGGRLVGVDRDPEALERAGERLAGFGSAVTLVRGNFRDLPDLLGPLRLGAVDGVLLDLGVSREQLETPRRGFSFRWDGPLDMRMDPSQERTAAGVVNGLGERELESLFWEHGEERFAGRIARRIAEARRRKEIRTTGELADIVAGAVPRRGRIHPATRVFQALRIAVNEELEGLAEGLENGVSVLAGGGRLCVLTYHSLEDRLVKTFIRRRAGLIPLTKKPIMPAREEVLENPSGRSAKLRGAEKIM